MRADPFPVVLLCFLLSGFAGLLFETLWTREFALVFGTSELAVATVLAAYMGGLAAGAALARRWVLRTRRPLLVYGILELGIGLSALAVPFAVRASTALSVALFGGHDAPPEAAGMWLPIYYLVCSFLILLVPTGLMGATLPLLTRFAVRSEEQIGSRVATLYATNTTGAVLGTLTSAFLLLPNLGLRGTLWVGVGVNALVFALAAFVARRSPFAVAESAEATPQGPTRQREWILPLLLLAGVTSFTYEVLWTRLLGHLFGGTVYAFATMLASFLTGIAVGSAVAGRFARTRNGAMAAFSISQIGVAGASVGAFLALDHLPPLAVALGVGSGVGSAGSALVAASVLLPGALFIGASFPLAVRVLARSDVDASPASARAYAWNTVGAIVGSIGAGFLWIPALGYSGSLVAAATLNLALAGFAAWIAGAALRPIAALAAAGIGLLWLVPPAPPWQLIATSALDLRAGRVGTFSPEGIEFFTAGRSATVLLASTGGTGWGLYTNGLPEGFIRAKGTPLRAHEAHWLASLGVLARPEARSMLVIGLGAGATLEEIPASVEQVDVIELEPAVLEANRSVGAQRAVDPLVDPRVKVSLNDARGALALTTRRYDIVASQPSHPWTAGASHLFTTEFFQQVRQHLEPGGVLVQWMDVEFLDEPLLRSLLATLEDVLPHVRLYWLPRSGVTLFLASDEPLAVEENALRALREQPLAFSHLGVYAPDDLRVLLALDEEAARRFSEGAPVSRDSHNLFQFRAPRALAAPLGTAQMEALLAPYDPLQQEQDATTPHTPSLARRLVTRGALDRAARLADRAGSDAEKSAVLGIARLGAGARKRAETDLQSALRADPGQREARVALARRLRRDPLGARVLTGSAEADPQLDAVVAGWRAAAAERWSAVRALEPALAGVPRTDALLPDALRLRAQWRVETGEAVRASEALPLLDDLLALSASPADAVLQSRATRAAGAAGPALETLHAIVDGLTTDNRNNLLVLDLVAEALTEFPEDDVHADQRAELASALAAARLGFQRP